MLLVGTAAASLLVGVRDVSFDAVVAGDPEAWRLLVISRIPRLLSLLLAGSAMSVAGLVMQTLTRNRFVSPSTAGTVESATLGTLVAIACFGAASVMAKMAIAAGFALAGTACFVALIRRLPPAETAAVPLVGIMFGGVVQAVAVYIAFRFDLLQSMNVLASGSFASVVAGRYELLFVVGALTVAIYVLADRLTVAGLGRDMARSLGLDHERVLMIGLGLASTVTGVVVVVVGALPFLGLVVPNAVTAIVGDSLRRAVPVTALGGASFVLLCDIVGRVVRAPYELPVGSIAGVVGGGIFLVLLGRSQRRGSRTLAW